MAKLDQYGEAELVSKQIKNKKDEVEITKKCFDIANEAFDLEMKKLTFISEHGTEEQIEAMRKKVIAKIHELEVFHGGGIINLKEEIPVIDETEDVPKKTGKKLLITDEKVSIEKLARKGKKRPRK